MALFWLAKINAYLDPSSLYISYIVKCVFLRDKACNIITNTACMQCYLYLQYWCQCTQIWVWSPKRTFFAINKTDKSILTEESTFCYGFFYYDILNDKCQTSNSICYSFIICNQTQQKVFVQLSVLFFSEKKHERHINLGSSF